MSHLSLRTLAATAVLLTGVSHAGAQTSPAPEGVLSLTASATVEAAQDWMTLVLSVTREGADANQVQLALKQAVEGALVPARKAARPGWVEVRTGSFAVYPRYGSKGTITGWQGSTELVIEGRDMPAIAQLSGQIGSLTISRVGYSLSREAREKLQAEATAQAIGRFRAQAADYTHQFGFGGYTLREVQVNAEAPMVLAEARSRVAFAAAAPRPDGEPLAVEAGKGSVTATVSGAIQMK